MFCQRCTSMLATLNDGVKKLNQTVTADEAIRSRDAGCYICYILLHCLSKVSPSDELQDLNVRWEYDTVRDCITAKIKAGIDVDFDLAPRRPKKAKARQPITSNETYQAPVHSSDPEAHRLVSTWLQRCTSSHKHCERFRNPLYVPPRLLDVRNSQLRLVEASDTVTVEGYATLSHCWGKNPTFLRLTPSNLDQFTRSIPMADLPKTFQDSVVLCRNLGIAYLWIDSLCIMQGNSSASQKDWFHHVAVMPEIYRSALLNISADSGRSSNDGLFSKRNNALLEWPGFAFDNGILKGQHSLDEKIFDTLHMALSGAPLQERGWVMQERIFSPRIVHFLAEQLYWECSVSNSVCERRLDGKVGKWQSPDRVFFGLIPPEYSRPLLGRLNNFIGHLSQLLRGSMGVARKTKSNSHWPEAIEKYAEIVQEFTERKLTYSADKLPAFGAIAEYFSDIFKSKYAAGMFECHFPQALAWNVNKMSREECANPTARCPSWSWVSIDGSVTLSGLRKITKSTPLSQLESYSVTLNDPNNPFGQITNASISIRAPLLRCAWDVGETEDLKGNGIKSFDIPALSPVRPPHGWRKFSFDALEHLVGSQSDVWIALLSAGKSKEDYNTEPPDAPLEIYFRVSVVVLREHRLEGALRYCRIGGGSLHLSHEKRSAVLALPQQEITIV